MERALRLAQRGLGSVEPNPAVGAVIVKDNRVIGRGHHKKFGGPHAEINALEDCAHSGNDSRGATIYVTLEPCSHQGKTGPCTEALISAGLKRVFVAMIDPSEHASGRGIEQLRRAGIEVEIGLCETEARLLNAPFVKYAATGRCWVTLKWAQSIDGKLAWTDTNQENQWISNELSRKDVHKLRRRVQGILVGINTILADDPLLTVRPSKGRRPIRILLDSHLRIRPDCQLLRTTKESPVMIVTRQDSIDANPRVASEIRDKGAELFVCPDTPGRSNLVFLLDELSHRGIGHLLVEGGPTVLTSFLKEDLADEMVVYIAPEIFGARGGAEITRPMAELAQSIGLRHVDVKRFGDDVRLSGLTQKGLHNISVGEAGYLADE
jgi:diaminohydroxyphosphoribosylaminopyrimidine deaminase/5-amino-6-(5-phosphoribosylamino)uracil reductase